MSTDKQDKHIQELAIPLKETRFELSYISKPTPYTVKYVFQHAVAISYGEALTTIASARAVLTEEAQAAYDNDPDLQRMMSEAINSPTVQRPRRQPR